MKFRQFVSTPRQITKTFKTFFHHEASGGLLLLLAALTAFATANSAWKQEFLTFWEASFTLGTGGMETTHGLKDWINDGLMTVFFFVVGLEIKRELLHGELASPKRAVFPMAAALGGMVAPALLYLAWTSGTPASRGWGTPMATDIAFALGALALLGSRVPFSLKVFLTALAIVDDLGAVLVIALFYSSHLSPFYLGCAGGLLLILFALNRLGVRQTAPFLVVGAGMWWLLLHSGLHATLAGVLTAMAFPPASQPEGSEETEAASEVDADNGGHKYPIEETLHPWVTYLILPLFALANAGVAVGGEPVALLAHPVGLGIMTGLVVGKQIGITLFAWFAVRLGLATKPTDLSWWEIYGVGWLGGIGFTMAIFIANLAFAGTELLSIAKVGVMTASLVAGAVGWLILRQVCAPAKYYRTGKEEASPAPN